MPSMVSWSCDSSVASVVAKAHRLVGDRDSTCSALRSRRRRSGRRDTATRPRARCRRARRRDVAAAAELPPAQTGSVARRRRCVRGLRYEVVGAARARRRHALPLRRIRRVPRLPLHAARHGNPTSSRSPRCRGSATTSSSSTAMRAAVDARRRRRSARSPTAASASAATRCWSSSRRSAGDVDFRYRIFNADGGEVEQCGNGARCFVVFVRDHGLTDKREIRVETAGGIIVPRLEDDGEVTRRHGRAALRRRGHSVRSAARARSPSRSTSPATTVDDLACCRWAIRTRCRSSPTSTPRR